MFATLGFSLKVEKCTAAAEVRLLTNLPVRVPAEKERTAFNAHKTGLYYRVIAWFFRMISLLQGKR
jgi:hypothetical protein